MLGIEDLKASSNEYDWLGHGIYFWDNSPSRAFEYASFLKNNPSRSKNPILIPSVIGAAISLGVCLDLLDYSNLSLLRESYDFVEQHYKQTNTAIPQNHNIGANTDLLLRKLDGTVIENLHRMRVKLDLPPFDSVRGVFWEGNELYPNAGFREKDHIQLCIRNPNCIKGYFLPRKYNENFNRV
ncbi:MAG TPA: hypothetical protein VD993_16575 [Chitinophagaceae bacterium]|nr:hypothetical protein [Chitinophagaceae bacterium]